MKCMPDKDDLNYKWERRSGNLPPRAQGTHTSNLVIVNLRPIDAGDYRCVVSNSTGTISSNFSSLVINGTYVGFIMFHQFNKGSLSYCKFCAIIGVMQSTLACQL